MVATWTQPRTVTNDHILPYISSSDQSTPAASKAALNTLPFQRNVFKLLANSPLFFPKFMADLGACFSNEKAVRPSDWQLAVLLTSRILNAPYEWDVNAPLAKLLPAFQPWEEYEPLIARRDLSSSLFNERQRLIGKFCEEVHGPEHHVCEATMEALKNAGFGADQIMELFMITGIYGTLARMMVSAKIDFDEPIEGLEDMLKNTFSEEIKRDQRFLDEARKHTSD